MMLASRSNMNWGVCRSCKSCFLMASMHNAMNDRVSDSLSVEINGFEMKKVQLQRFKNMLAQSVMFVNCTFDCKLINIKIFEVYFGTFYSIIQIQNSTIFLILGYHKNFYIIIKSNTLSLKRNVVHLLCDSTFVAAPHKKSYYVAI